MVTRQRYWLHRLATSATLALLLVLATARYAPAQEPREDDQSSTVADIVKGVVFDPTTYAPALISYDATMRDWNTSQPFFHNGYLEYNARFTVTGRPNGIPVSYAVGKNQILKDTLATLGATAAQNLTSRVVERALMARYPEHRKVVKTIGWIQRIGLASLMSYNLSAAHYRQAAYNASRARELGYR
jgi:hypothetical protein